MSVKDKLVEGPGKAPGLNLEIQDFGGNLNMDFGVKSVHTHQIWYQLHR